MEGNYLETLTSKQLEEKLHTSLSVICDVLAGRNHGNSLKGYQIRRYGEEPPGKLTYHYKTKAIDCFDLKGNFIKTYPSIKDALIELGLKPTFSGISNCLTGRGKSSKGYK